MNRKKLLILLNKLLYAFELLVSVLLIIGVVCSIPDILDYYPSILHTNNTDGLQVLSQFLSHVLMLVIAIEFIFLMIAHTDHAIIHLITLMIARKMLVVSDTLLDVLLGVIAIAILFFTKKYLIVGAHADAKEIDGSTIFSAATLIGDINKRYNYDIDPQGTETLAGLVSKLLEKRGLEPEIGEVVDDGKYAYEIQKSSMGIIEEISIEKL